MLLLALVILALYLASGLFLGMTASPPVSEIEDNLWHKHNLIADLATDPAKDPDSWPLWI